MRSAFGARSVDGATAVSVVVVVVLDGMLEVELEGALLLSLEGAVLFTGWLVSALAGAAGAVVSGVDCAKERPTAPETVTAAMAELRDLDRLTWNSLNVEGGSGPER